MGRKHHAFRGCPTPVGVYPSFYLPLSAGTRLPHAGGGLPRSGRACCRTSTVAPRRWGSTCHCLVSLAHAGGCPTPVGVYHPVGWLPPRPWRLPHAGGGLPCTGVLGCRPLWVAPRRWGSTVHRHDHGDPNQGCPTPVGVYLIYGDIEYRQEGLPHAGGGLP